MIKSRCLFYRGAGGGAAPKTKITPPQKFPPGAGPQPKTIVVFLFPSPPGGGRAPGAASPPNTGTKAAAPRREASQGPPGGANHEIVTTVVSTLRNAGLDARLGSEQPITAGDEMLLVTGHLRGIDQGNRTQRNVIGFGAGRSDVVADTTVSYVSSSGTKQLLTFTADAKSGRMPGAAVTAPFSAVHGAALVASSVGSSVLSEKLSSDVEAQARKIGHTAGDRIVAYAKEQGWLEKQP